MRVLDPIVEPAAGHLSVIRPDLLESRPLEPESIGHQFLRPAVPLHQLAQELQRSLLVPVLGHISLQDLSLLVQRSS